MQMSKNQMSGKVMFLDSIRYAADQNNSEMFVDLYNPAKRRDL